MSYGLASGIRLDLFTLGLLLVRLQINPRARIRRKLMYIFWDNSNIHFAGLNHVFPMKEPGLDKRLYRTYFKGLLDLVANGRTVDKIYFAGSEPPKEDKLWEAAKRLGATVQVMPRCATGREEDTVDHLLELEILRLGYDNKPDTLALLTGDGAGWSEGRGFLSDSRRLVEKGWDLEVYSWDAACNSELKNYALRKGKYIPLESYYECVTFISNGRKAKLLSE